MSCTAIGSCLSAPYPLIAPPFPSLFSFSAPAPTAIYTLSLHDALPIWPRPVPSPAGRHERPRHDRAPPAPALRGHRTGRRGWHETQGVRERSDLPVAVPVAGARAGGLVTRGPRARHDVRRRRGGDGVRAGTPGT